MGICPLLLCIVFRKANEEKLSAGSIVIWFHSMAGWGDVEGCGVTEVVIFVLVFNRAEECLGFLWMSHTGWRKCVCERWHVWANNQRPISAWLIKICFIHTFFTS